MLVQARIYEHAGSGTAYSCLIEGQHFHKRCHKLGIRTLFLDHASTTPMLKDDIDIEETLLDRSKRYTRGISAPTKQVGILLKYDYLGSLTLTIR